MDTGRVEWLLQQAEEGASEITDTQDALRVMCLVQAAAAEVVGYAWAADCFCGDLKGGDYKYRDHPTGYRHDGENIRWIIEAMRDRIAGQGGS